jgi:hypothetical protein
MNEILLKMGRPVKMLEFCNECRKFQNIHGYSTGTRKMKDRMKLSLTKFGTKKGLAKEGTKK